ncbi:MAG TPA: hypothetical protein VFJ16_00170 [Longimicrobium sp.]|nr:hypothetical protein [Longimicrobium sp.]
MRPDGNDAVGAPLAAGWALWRQDDNGNRVRIETFATREAAVARQAEFESRHHKQIYWVEEA